MSRSRLQTWQQFDPNRKNNNSPNLSTPSNLTNEVDNFDPKVDLMMTYHPPAVDESEVQEVTASVDHLLDETNDNEVETPKPKTNNKKK